MAALVAIFALPLRDTAVSTMDEGRGAGTILVATMAAAMTSLWLCHVVWTSGRGAGWVVVCGGTIAIGALWFARTPYVTEPGAGHGVPVLVGAGVATALGGLLMAARTRVEERADTPAAAGAYGEAAAAFGAVSAPASDATAADADVEEDQRLPLAADARRVAAIAQVVVLVGIALVWAGISAPLLDGDDVPRNGLVERSGLDDGVGMALKVAIVAAGACAYATFTRRARVAVPALGLVLLVLTIHFAGDDRLRASRLGFNGVEVEGGTDPVGPQAPLGPALPLLGAGSLLLVAGGTVRWRALTRDVAPAAGAAT